MSQVQSAPMPVLFVPHGGGPLPLLGDARHQQLSEFLTGVANTLKQPKAIVLLSAHWEEAHVTINCGASPGMLYDYYGFPPAAYQVNYPAPGSPVLADNIRELLTFKGIAYQVNNNRGYDHGVFVPLLLMYPEAQVPVVQLSLLSSLDAAEHIAIGEALAPLREQGVLIIGSGMSFHNMQAFFTPSAEVTEKSQQFDTWLKQRLTSPELSDSQRISQISQWRSAPFARYCHPREEHLLPLMVCLGAAKGKVATNVFGAELMNAWISGFKW